MGIASQGKIQDSSFRDSQFKMSAPIGDLDASNVDQHELPANVEVSNPSNASKRPGDSARPENSKRVRQENAYKVM